MNKKVFFSLSLILMLSLFLAACGDRQQLAGEQVTIRVAVLPILDGLPMYVAEAQGYFAENNIKVEFIPVASAPERDQLMQAGQVDAMITDMTSVMFYNKEKPVIKVVRFAKTATSQYPHFYILSGKGSGINSANDLRGIEIAISHGTVIEYLTERLLQAEGLSESDIKTVAIPKIPDRLAALADGTVKAATIPDPAAAAALAGGAGIVIDDSKYPFYGYSLVAFDAKFASENVGAVKSFLAAWEKAVLEINADKTKWDEVLRINKLLAEPLIGKYRLPDYPLASVPSEAQFKDVNEWVKDKGLVTIDISYEESVNSSYLP